MLPANTAHQHQPVPSPLCVFPLSPFSSFLSPTLRARPPPLLHARLSHRYDYRRGRDRVFLKAVCDIPAGCEVLVGYGSTYWDWHDDRAA